MELSLKSGGLRWNKKFNGVVTKKKIIPITWKPVRHPKLLIVNWVSGVITAWPVGFPESAIPNITPLDLGNHGVNTAVAEKEPMAVYPNVDTRL